eukprot:1583308-Pyramimonas_sp.AAC.1
MSPHAHWMPSMPDVSAKRYLPRVESLQLDCGANEAHDVPQPEIVELCAYAEHPLDMRQSQELHRWDC